MSSTDILHSHREAVEDYTSLGCARQWLYNCVENHERCRKTLSKDISKTMPGRLLRLGLGPQSDMIQLVTSKEIENRNDLRYCTLSHCWGEVEVIKLTTTTQQNLVEGLEISKLPNTFRDAVVLCQKLDIDFLWIDSLCILQDSVDDWIQESSIMGDIYAGSYCNIAASQSHNPNSGCLYDGPLSLTQPLVVRPSWNNRDYGDHAVGAYDFTTEFERGPLKKRGWVVQETLLAPRELFLHQGQLWWQCGELFACEMYPCGMPDTARPARLSSQFRYKMLLHSVREPSFEAASVPYTSEEIEGFWNEIVCHYTSCKLTRSEDKLVAISAIARIFQRLLDDQYLAGLWKRRLGSQLLWRLRLTYSDRVEAAKLSSQPLTRHSRYRAPSWSWASVDGEIRFSSMPADRRECLVKVHETQVTAINEDPMGQVVGGFLRISGGLFTVIIDRLRDYFVNIQINQQWHQLDHYNLALDEELSSSNFHCLPVNKIKEWSNEYTLECLLLKETSHIQGQFHRVGTITLLSRMFSSNGPSFTRLDIHAFKKFTKHDWFSYEESNGEGIYTISII
jgi:hypothetical protein